MHWKYEDLFKWIENKCPPVDNVTSLDISFCMLDKCPREISMLGDLKILDISNNLIEFIPNWIGKLCKLKKLKCHNNCRIASIPSEIKHLKSLHELLIYNNRIKSLPLEFGNLKSLHTFDISYNKLQSLPVEIGNMKALRIFLVHNNEIEAIPLEFYRLNMLTIVNFSNNRITSLSDQIGNLTAIKSFNIMENYITSIPMELVNCHDLIEFNFQGNPVEYVPPNVQRFIQHNNQPYHGIYDDSQSVHKSSVQQSVKKSIEELFKIKPLHDYVAIQKMILDDTVLSSETKQRLINYSHDTDVHSVLQITFAELLVVVWNRIIQNENCKEIKKILNQEMDDTECKCFTGRMSRLVNCLGGFDKCVEIKIADNEQIGTIIGLIERQLGHNYNVEKHRELVRERLTELGYSDEIIDNWVKFIE